jgi:hypothetical protein
MNTRNLSWMSGALLCASALLPLWCGADVAPKPPATLCIGAKCSGGAVSTTGSSLRGIKWHPGHYAWYSPGAINGVSGYRLDVPGHRDAVLSFLDSISSEPSVKGVLVAVYWKALEGDTPGNYQAGFAALDAILARAAQYNKKVMLRLEARVDGHYAALTDVFPAYVANGAGFGTAVVNHNDGSYSSTTARVWQAATADRLIALTQAYGARYNSHPALEMFTLGETALNVADGLEGFSASTWLTQLQRLLIAGRAAFPNTAIRVSANDLWPDSLMQRLLATCEQYSITVGGPDVWPLDVTQADRVFAGLDQAGQSVSTDYRDRLPWAVEAQWQSFAGKFTMQQLWNAQALGYTAPNTQYIGGPKAGQNFAMPSMKVRYFIWYVNEVNGDPSTQWKTAELPLIRSLNGAPASASCPSSYPNGCNGN